MSKGTKRKTVRIPLALEVEILKTIQRRNQNTREKPWEFGDFVRIACAEKVSKMNRSRKNGPQLKTGPIEEWKETENSKLKLPGEQDDFNEGFYTEA